MKKRNLWFTLMLVPLLGVMTSCEEEDAGPQPPSLDFKGGSEYIAQDATVNIGSDFTIGINVASNAETEEDLSNVEVTRTFDNVPQTVLDTTFDNNVTSFSVDMTFETQAEEGDERIVFKAEDAEGEVVEKEIIITYESAPVSLNEYTMVLLGAQSSAEPSCASLESGDRYSISGDEAANNSDQVDIVHYNGARDVALYSPSNSDIQGVSAYGISDWATKNDTKLSVTSLTAAEFDDIATNEDLLDAGTPDSDVVGLLELDDVVVFETAGGKKGVFKVADIVDSADGSVTIDVKVE